MSRDSLGEFEHMVLLAILRHGGEAYSVPIVLELEQRTGRSVAPAAVYIALRRLEKRGLLRSTPGPILPHRRRQPPGHRRRHLCGITRKPIGWSRVAGGPPGSTRPWLRTARPPRITHRPIPRRRCMRLLLLNPLVAISPG